MAYDPFDRETGLLGNVDVTFTDAIFTNRLESANPERLELHLTMLVEGDDGGEQVQYLSCGDGWETNDGGKTAVREDGKERNFHANTKTATLFNSMVDLMGKDPACDKELRARVEEFPTGSREAGFWKGLRVHLDREERDGGSDIGKYEVLVATEFLGTVGGGKTGGAKKAAPAKKAAKKAAAAKPKADDAGSALTDALIAQLDEIADASEDHDAFMEAAFAQVPEASTDETVKAAVADDSSDDGIWQRAVARYQASVEG